MFHLLKINKNENNLKDLAMKTKMLFLLILIFSLSNINHGFSQPWANAAVEQRAQALLQKMTLDEKLAYIGGDKDFYIREISRLGIPAIKMSDGPQGLRNDGKTNAMPCSILLSATWNKDLAFAYGKALGEDAKARAVHILLGPAVNIYRAPMCGRNFEYFGEDPYLTSRTAVGYINGVQSEGVMATIKHFAANDQEWDRNFVSSDVDERTMHEIYLPAFEAAVRDANVGAVMCSYNLLNGIYTSQNKWLLTDVLRKQWGFRGIMMSDWGATHNCVEAANNGLDLEMPRGDYMQVDSLKMFLKEGKIKETTIDEKVLRILRTVIGFGFFDRNQLNTQTPLDNPVSAKTALNVAREGIVLLKNQDNILPLHTGKIKKIAVCGANASRFVTGGGSGWLDPFHAVTTLDGIRKMAAESNIEVSYVAEYTVPEKELFVEKNSAVQGLKAQYFNNMELKGNPKAERIDPSINFDWRAGTGIAGMPDTKFSVRWTGVIRPTQTNIYNLAISGDDGYRLIVDGKVLAERWENGSVSTKSVRLNLEANKDYSICIEYYQDGGDASVNLEWSIVDQEKLRKSLADADLIVACIGFNASTESEGSDRTFKLPPTEVELLDFATAAGKPVIAVVNAGGSVEMQDWYPKVNALLWAWYPGQEGGTAIAEVLFGKVNPSGKLPVTFEKKWEDNPTFNSYYDPDNDKRVTYSEGIFVGYRGYDKLNRDVQFPFGFGLSYTTFQLSDIAVLKPSANAKLSISCKIKNNSTTDGAEVVQLYVGKTKSKVSRPVKELKAYAKVFLKAGETKTVTLEVSKRELSYYSVKLQNFVFEPGAYHVMIGNSSRDIVLQKNVVLK